MRRRFEREEIAIDSVDWCDSRSVKYALARLFRNNKLLPGILLFYDYDLSNGASTKDAFINACENAIYSEKSDNQAAITDRQAEIIGREIGKTIISEAYFLRDLARTIGENIRIKV